MNQARMFVALKPFNERKASPDGIIARLRAPLGGVTGAPTYLQPVQDLRIGEGSARAYTSTRCKGRT